MTMENLRQSSDEPVTGPKQRSEIFSTIDNQSDRCFFYLAHPIFFLSILCRGKMNFPCSCPVQGFRLFGYWSTYTRITLKHGTAVSRVEQYNNWFHLYTV